MLSLISYWGGWICLVLLFVGLYEPWWVLWWRPTQNRRQVVTLYGTLTLVFFLIYNLLNWK